tara:strand:+ start:122 stop:1651 length:1530 start_codon:yes stop_codon:yes gene_type:complete
MNNVIVSPHYLSTEIGSTIFNKGGNAVDAAILTNLVQGIVAPETCGIGGDLFALVWVPGKNKPEFLDASGYSGSNVDTGLLSNYENIPLNHPLSVTIPGAVAGWRELSNKYGTIPIEDILDIGINLCHEGFTVSKELFNSLTVHSEELSGQKSGYSFYRNNQPYSVDTLIRRAQLGKTLELLKDHGLEYFYNGEIAKEISNSVNGFITEGDLSNYKAKWREPLHQKIYGYDGWTSPPSTQGYLTLSALKGFEMISNKEDYLHALIESYRIFASDRDNITFDYQGNDKDFLGTNDDYIKDKISLFGNQAAGKYSFPNPHGGGTAYMNAVDKNGLGISLIQSNFYGIGSRIGVGKYGFFLHNRGCGFNLIKGHPNSLGPNKKPLHTLSPTIWSKDGSLDFITGTRGGRYQPQLLAQTILPYILEKSSFEEIMKKPRWTIEYFGSDTASNIKFEFLNETEKSSLEDKGHNISIGNKLIGGYGPVSTIYKNSDGNFIGVPDIRVGTEKAFNSF